MLRYWATGFNTTLALTLAVLLTLMVNYISTRHNIRLDISRSQFYALSAKTLGLLERLQTEVRVTVFLSMDHELYRDIQRLLTEYETASPRIQVRYIDPHRDLASGKDLILKYDLTEPDVILFEAAGRRRVLAVKDLADFDFSPVLAGRPKPLTAFRGEQSFSSAIQNLLQAQRPVVYFLTGHGEHRIDHYDQLFGYSLIARALQRDTMDVRSFHFGQSPAVPSDCDVLVIGGPTRRLSRMELDFIKTYLENFGRLFILLDPGVDSGLEKLLATWEVKLSDDRVIGQTLSGRDLLINTYGEHPITAHMKTITTLLQMPRSIQPMAITHAPVVRSADKPRVTVLALSSDKGWSEMSPQQTPPRFDADVDRPGPIPVAVAVEKGPTQGLDVEIKSSRLVVVGDSMFIANGSLLSGYNAAFFLNAMNWLLERGETLAIPAKEPATSHLVIGRDVLRSIYGVILFGIPAAMLGVGALVWWRRRSG